MLDEMYINIDLEPIPQYVKLSGVSFYNRQNIIAKLHIGDNLILMRDYKNQYDKFAVGAYTLTNDFVGWIPRYAVENLAREIDNGIIWSAEVSNITGEKYDTKGINVQLICEVT